MTKFLFGKEFSKIELLATIMAVWFWVEPTVVMSKKIQVLASAFILFVISTAVQVTLLNDRK